MRFLNKCTLIALSSILLLSACGDPAIPMESKQYVTLPTQIVDKTLQPVTEVFSLTCSHCRNMENFIEQISKQAGADIAKIHVAFNQPARAAATVYYAVEMQLNDKPGEALMDELFAAIQMANDTPAAQRESTLEKIFRSRDLISPAQFSPQQNQQLMEKVALAARLSTQLGINSVPTFIVKGRYQVLVAGHDDPQQIADTIHYLLNK
ncbi:MAG: protein-disulfide isomerase [Psychromonas sp.]|jgi:protein-disulfide isomerase|uniref:thiol:disulfide interchange protein DsbA/DsbL n=1 Tax=Psychromonas sp. TaxID=1884585 RepID=UPI0039E459EB